MNWIAEKLAEHLKENPDHAFLYDESTAKGLTYRQFDELSGKVRAFLLDNRIGKEDFVLINLPRGSQPLIAAMGSGARAQPSRWWRIPTRLNGSTSFGRIAAASWKSTQKTGKRS